MIDVGSPFRPLPFRQRADLSSVRQSYRGDPFFVVGDALALEFYRFNEQEYFLLSSLDGRRTMHQIKERFEERFSPYRITYREIQASLIDFHQKSLLATPVSDRGRHLHILGRKKRLKKVWQNSKNILAFRWRGINPDICFRLFTKAFGWLFSKPVFVFNLFLMTSALVWVLVHFQIVQAKLPSVQEFFVSSNWLPLMSVFIIMKLLHEFGHGIVFTRLGGRCHELGIMFLVFIPTMYVNTSESWRLPNKWQRIAVAGAGIYVELVLAALATFGWWYSKPGMFQYVCLNVMVLGSISAILFNGNPLLKFDGYFMLSDWLEIPNLQQRSGAYIRDKFLRWGMGIREGDEHLSPHRIQIWLATYAVAAYLFRIYLVYVIAFLILGLATTVGLQEMARMFSFGVMLMLIIIPLFALGKYFWVPGRFQKRESFNVRILALLTTFLVLVFLFLPIRARVTCDFIVEPEGTKTAYANHDGVLEIVLVKPGDSVSNGQPIAHLRDIDTEIECAEIRGEISALESELNVLQLTSDRNDENAAKTRELRQSILSRQKLLTELETVRSELVVRAPQSGQVVPRWYEGKTTVSTAELKTWEGWTLADENRNAFFERGQPLCDVGNLSQPVAKLLVDQSDVEFIKQGQRARLMINSFTANVVVSYIQKIAEGRSTEVAASVSHKHGGSVESKEIDPPYSEITEDSYVDTRAIVYELTAPIPNFDRDIEIGTRGKARIDIEPQTLSFQLIRFLCKTFRIEL